VANIILTYECVNRCPYCFAADIDKGERKSRLTREEFDFYVALLKRSGYRHVSLLGGEPFLHPDIGEFLDRLANDNEVRHVTIFTSGFVPAKYYTRLLDSRTGLVVNVNSPADYPAGQFSVLCGKLRELADRGAQMVLGYNIYREDFDYLPLVELASELGCRAFRWTVAKPAADRQTQCLRRPQVPQVIPRLLEFLQACRRAGLKPIMDCPLEPCLFSDEQLATFCRLSLRDISKMGCCPQAVDLGPGYRVLRCFTAASLTEQDCRKYNTIADILRHYDKTVETHRACAVAEPCRQCPHWISRDCVGGCLGETAPEVRQVERKMDQLPELLSRCNDLYRQQRRGELLDLLGSQVGEYPLPNLIVEYANALLRLGKNAEFTSVVQKYETVLRRFQLPRSAFLLAKYHALRGNASATLGFLRRAQNEVRANADDDFLVRLRKDGWRKEIGLMMREFESPR